MPRRRGAGLGGGGGERGVRGWATGEVLGGRWHYPLLSLVLSYARSIRRNCSDPEFQVIGITFGVLLAAGTVFYSLVEGWGLLDALYFCVMTLATIGYGDFSPKTALGKVFTSVYVLVGIG